MIDIDLIRYWISAQNYCLSPKCLIHLCLLLQIQILMMENCQFDVDDEFYCSCLPDT